MAEKPPFDPSQPFTAAGGDKPPFDPSKPFTSGKAESGPTKPHDYSWSEVPGAMAKNAGPSAVRFAKDVAQPFLHPIETATNVYHLGRGVIQYLNERDRGLNEKAGGYVPTGTDDEKYAKAVGQYLVDRYGSLQAVKNSMATDPVGVMADASMVLSGGGGLAARAPGIVGKVGEIVGTVGRVTNPVATAGYAAKGTAKLGSHLIGGLVTGTGGRAIDEAFMSGAKAFTEPQQGRTFREHYTGRVDPAEAVDIAQRALSSMIKERGDEYVKSMRSMGQNKQVLNFNDIDAAVQSSLNVGKFKGVITNPSVNDVRQKILDRIAMWKGLDPAEYHTPEGMDALKKSIRDIRDEPGNKDNFGRLTAPGLVAEDVAKGIEKTITKAAPEYGRIMKAYSEASDIINNIQRELSLGRNANVDTGLKKLQSVLRNNVTTNYGRRETLAKMLMDHGATDLMAALAGQSLSTLIPRGLAARMLAAAEGFAGLTFGEGGERLLKAAGALTLSSPLIVGGAAHGAGVAASPVYGAAKAGERIGVTPGRVGRGAYVLGRESELQ